MNATLPLWFVLACVAMVVSAVIWIPAVVAWFQNQARDVSPRDGGVPRNILPPRNRWELHTDRVMPGLYVRIRRQRYRDVRDSFNGSMIEKWVSLEITVIAFGRRVLARHWRERWAA